MDKKTLNHLRSILFIDIETVGMTAGYEALPERFKPLWDRKAGFLHNDENLTEAGLYNQRAGIYAEFGKIVCIGTGYFAGTDDRLELRVKDISSHDEKALLTEFKELLHKFGKNLLLCAHNGKEFDYPYLCRRMLVNCIPLPEILNQAGKKPWDVPHLDTLELWKFGDRKSYTSLELLAALFGIEGSKTDMDGSKVNEVYYQEQNLSKIARYCKEDVVVTAQLYLKMKCLPAIDKEQVIFV